MVTSLWFLIELMRWKTSSLENYWGRSCWHRAQKWSCVRCGARGWWCTSWDHRIKGLFFILDVWRQWCQPLWGRTHHIGFQSTRGCCFQCLSCIHPWPHLGWGRNGHICTDSMSLALQCKPFMLRPRYWAPLWASEILILMWILALRMETVDELEYPG